MNVDAFFFHLLQPRGPHDASIVVAERIYRAPFEGCALDQVGNFRHGYVSVHVHSLHATLADHDLPALGSRASLRRWLSRAVAATAEKKHPRRSTSHIP